MWHLVGQLYCSFWNSPKEITENTILNEEAFRKALLESNRDLFSVYKRQSRSKRNQARAILCSLSPFRLEEVVDEQRSVPFVVDLGIKSNTLYQLCEKYDPAELEKVFRYSFSEASQKKSFKGREN